MLVGYGGPEKLEYRTDVPKPEPVAGEVLVEIGACGVNNTDLWIREGAYGQVGRPGGRGWLVPRVVDELSLDTGVDGLAQPG